MRLDLVLTRTMTASFAIQAAKPQCKRVEVSTQREIVRIEKVRTKRRRGKQRS
jgi:hypothetical protein